MRLVCPNCDAEYEVDATAIPDEGRDVQCSNCGHAWFQSSLDFEFELDAEAALYGAEPEAEPDVTPEIPAVEAEIAEAVPVGRGLDETVIAVLREEAEREAAARRAEGTAVETQTEMGLAQVVAPVDTQARRVARIKGIDPDPAPPPPTRAPTRRELLPEIDEINSTLRARSERRPTETAMVAVPEVARQSGGFRNGFVLMLLVAVILLALYAMAPRIAEQIPDIAPAITGYVAVVDGLRIWLDEVMQMAISGLRDLTGRAG